jgi:hypothetical protein
MFTGHIVPIIPSNFGGINHCDELGVLLSATDEFILLFCQSDIL